MSFADADEDKRLECIAFESSGVVEDDNSLRTPELDHSAEVVRVTLDAENWIEKCQVEVS